MKARIWLSTCLALATAAVLGCGGPKPPDMMVYISMVQANGTPAQRDVKIAEEPDETVSVDVWELSEPKDLSKPPKKGESPMPPTKTTKVAKPDMLALWKGFPKGFWKLHDMKNENAPANAPSYTIELIYPGHHLKMVVDNPEQQSDKTPWQIIQNSYKLAGVQ